VSTLFNGAALWQSDARLSALLLVCGFVWQLAYLRSWSRGAENVSDDFQCIHRLMKFSAIAFGVFLFVVLLRGGIASIP
jgi:hypothetical protein